MPIPPETRLDRAVCAGPEAVEVCRDRAIGEVRDLGAQPGFQLGEREVVELRRRQRRHAGVPRLEPVGELDDSAVDARDAAHGVRPAPGQSQHDVAAPRLAGQNRAPETQRADQGEQVGNRGVEIVASLRGVRAPVTALVEPDHRVAERVKPLRHAVPQTDVGRQPVDEHEGNRGRLTLPKLDVQRDAGRHLDAPLAQRLPDAIRRLGHQVLHRRPAGPNPQPADGARSKGCRARGGEQAAA